MTMTTVVNMRMMVMHDDCDGDVAMMKVMITSGAIMNDGDA